MTTTKLLLTIRRELSRAGDKDAAKKMQAYMKSTMRYHGVNAAATRAIAKAAVKDVHFASSEEWQREVRAVFHGAKFREERYTAFSLLAHPSAKKFRTMDALPLYEDMITTGAWWDTVDELASHYVGALLDSYDPREAKACARAMRTWSKCDDLWKQRTSIICQISRKDRVDLALLEECIAPSIARKEFFLRKAIGWALRSVAWLNPTWVTRYVKEHPELSPLSQREALKNVLRGATRVKTKEPEKAAKQADFVPRKKAR